MSMPDLLRELVAGRVMPLGAGEPDRTALDQLSALTVEQLMAPLPVIDDLAAQACLAGLRLLLGDLAGSHKIAQDLPTAEGSYWHGMMHRREGDYWNAKYWFRRAGPHPTQADIAARAAEAARSVDMAPPWLTSGRWTPEEFTDWVEKPGTMRELCRGVGQIEWEVVFAYCWKSAGGEL